jgi:hypothetical protein
MPTLILKADFRPLCDRHYSAMMEPSTIQDSGATHRCCAEPDCTRHYDAMDGYFDVISGSRLQGKYDSPYSCPEHETKMYLASHNPSAKTETWACPFCDVSQTLRTE